MSFKLRIYLGQGMTGRSCREMVQEAKKVKCLFERHGLEVVSPVLEEGIPDVEKPLDYVTKETLLEEWALDKKKRLRSCHIMYDANGDRKSEGLSIERGHSRWYLWRPTVRCKPAGWTFSISDIEDDKIVSSHRQAALFIKKKWGTRRKWVMWKLPHILFGIPKHIFIQIQSLFL